MFEYAEEDLNKKINQLEDMIILKSEEEQGYKDSRNRILSYLDIKKTMGNSKKVSVGFSLVGNLFIVLGAFATIQFTNVYALMLVAIGFISCYVAGNAIHKITISKKQLKHEYSDICMFLDSELLKKVQSLKEKELIASSEITDLFREQNHHRIELDKINRYKNVIEKVFDELAKDPYYQATTEEEYQALVSISDDREKILNDFLIDTRNYSSMDFDNSLGDTIQYTEKSKKLFKKPVA